VNMTSLIGVEWRERYADILGLPSWVSALLIAWIVSMVSMPIFIWTFGPQAIPAVASLTVVLQALAVLSVLLKSVSWSYVVRLTLTVVFVAWFIEWAGSQTGLLFGRYDYTNLFRPQVLHVPALIPLAWLMMLPPAWAVGQILASRPSGIAFVLVSALAFTAWDLFLDPQMVAWGAWVWQEPGGYFGIPWHNYGGWFLSAALLTVLARPPMVPHLPLLLIYTVTWALQTVGLGLFWGMPGPALWGFLVMGAFVVLSWRSVRKPAISKGLIT
jgi:lycopene beta-cyclase